MARQARSPCRIACLRPLFRTARAFSSDPVMSWSHAAQKGEMIALLEALTITHD
jgi:hypothetical protein